MALRSSFLSILTALCAVSLAAEASTESPIESELGPLTSSKRLLTDSSLPCPGPDCAVDGYAEPGVSYGQGLRTVYLNFEGVNLTSASNNEDATNNISFLVANKHAPGNTVHVPPFSPSNLQSTQGASRGQIINYVVDKIRETHQPYNIEFTTTRPSSGTYHMVVFGGTCQGITGLDCAGLAHLDCGDFVPSNIVFVFPYGLRIQDLAATASQELSHAFGLSHTTDRTDIMYPFIQNYTPTEYGAGTIPQEDQATACGGGTYQDSHEKLLAVVGYRGQDTLPPQVLITSPANGEIVSIGDPIEADLSDDNTIVKVELLLNNALFDTRTSPPFDFTLPADSPLGQVAIKLRATDDSGNSASSRVTAYVGTGDEEPCINGACPEGFSCVDMLCYAEQPGSTGALGDICTDSEDCDSGLCAILADEQLCSLSCTADTECPQGFECLGEVACWPVEEESGGCAVSGHGGRDLSFGLMAMWLMLMLGGSRGRR